jgi:hypothetical protein
LSRGNLRDVNRRSRYGLNLLNLSVGRRRTSILLLLLTMRSSRGTTLSSLLLLAELLIVPVRPWLTTLHVVEVAAVEK